MCALARVTLRHALGPHHCHFFACSAQRVLLRAGGAVRGAGHQAQHGGAPHPVQRQRRRGGHLQLQEPQQRRLLQGGRRAVHAAAGRAEAEHRALGRRAAQHGAVHAAPPRVEGGRHPAAGLWQPQQGGAVLRAHLLGQQRQPVRPRGKHHYQQRRVIPLLEPLPRPCSAGARGGRGRRHHGERERRRDRGQVHRRAQGHLRQHGRPPGKVSTRSATTRPPSTAPSCPAFGRAAASVTGSSAAPTRRRPPVPRGPRAPRPPLWRPPPPSPPPPR
ncbi:hypothetical protein FOCC_FOCC003170 [Frankliniella occidentalis]|nr:hypothetical protein FOCC_FOCC003170 [Frankliniella occidentalis]